MGQLIIPRDDLDLIAAFAGCSLDEKPGSNWVQDNGGLPDYICRIARAVKRTGKTTGLAISIAVGRAKVWATGKGVDHDTQVKAAAAVAEWEKLKAKAKVKRIAKTAAHAAMTGQGPVLMLAATTTDYPVDLVTTAWQDRVRNARDDWRKNNTSASYDDPDCPPYLWVKEQWTTFLIVQSDYGKNPKLWKVPYTVDDQQNVTFGDPVAVKQEYIVIDDGDLDGSEITDEDLKKWMDLTGPCPGSAVDIFLNLTPRPTALERVIHLAQKG
jgi:hypothetical protein